MRPTPPGWPEAIAASHAVAFEVTSWLNGAQLRNVPILDGMITYDASARLPRRLSATVPLQGPDGYDWTPLDPATHPLGHMGQRLHVRAGIVMRDGTSAMADQGWYLITDWQTNRQNGTVTVNAADLSQLVIDALMGTDNTTAWGSDAIAWIPSPTYRTSMNDLMSGGDLPATTIPRPALLPWATAVPEIDWIVGTNVVYERDRWDTITNLLDLIGCKPRVADDGVLWVIPKVRTIGPVVATLSEGPGGTLAVSDLAGSRDQIHNYVVVYGKNPPQTSRLVTDPRSWAWVNYGALSAEGAFGPRVYVIDNDGLNDQDATSALAEKALQAGISTAWTRTVGVVPDPAIELDDVVTVNMKDGTTFTGSVVGIQLPLSYNGSMNVAISSRPPDARSVTTRSDP